MYLAISFSLKDESSKSNARKVTFRSNCSNGSIPLSRISFFPISINVPPGATQRHDSWKRSPVSELRTTSTPRLFVLFNKSIDNVIDREENMRSGAMSYSFFKKSRFSSVPAVTNIYKMKNVRSKIKE